MNEPAQASAPTIPVEFTGKTSEYFGIWIVNVLLIIITLGIYSAWAKVRTHRYFYGNTLLDGSPFDYLASPIAILKGWAIAVAVLFVYNILVSVFPLTSLLLVPLMLIALPWIIVRAMRFRAHNSAWRNIRFGFKKAYAEAAKVFILFSILIIFTLGLFLPYYIYATNRFVVANSGFGATAFSFHATAKDFYKIFLKPVLVMLVILGLVFAFSYQTIKDFSEELKTAIESAQTLPQESDETLYTEYDEYTEEDELIDEQSAEDIYADEQPEDPDTAYTESETEAEGESMALHQQSMDEEDEMMQQAMQDLAAANDNIEYEDAGTDMEATQDMEGSGDEIYESEYDGEIAQDELEYLDEDAGFEEGLDAFNTAASIGALLLILLSFVFYLGLIAYLQARIWNLVYNSTELAGNRFISSIRARDIAWLYGSNLIVISISFGLMIPWAKIRLARYRASKLLLVPAGNLDSFMQLQQQKVSALGEEMGDVFDLDIGI